MYTMKNNYQMLKQFNGKLFFFLVQVRPNAFLFNKKFKDKIRNTKN